MFNPSLVQNDFVFSTEGVYMFTCSSVTLLTSYNHKDNQMLINSNGVFLLLMRKRLDTTISIITLRAHSLVSTLQGQYK